MYRAMVSSTSYGVCTPVPHENLPSFETDGVRLRRLDHRRTAATFGNTITPNEYSGVNCAMFGPALEKRCSTVDIVRAGAVKRMLQLVGSWVYV